MAKPKKASKSKKLTEFTCFKKLAPELRIIIWKFAMPGANVVEILVDEGRDEDYNMTIIPCAHYKVPTLLQVSRESRGFALQIYTKILPNSFSDKPVFFNLDVDVLSINRSTLERLCEHGGFVIRYQRVADPPQPAFSGPLLQGLRRLQLLDDIPFWLLPHMKKILDAFGQPEMIVLHKPARRRVHSWSFLELEWDIKNDWALTEDEDGKCYRPKLHILTELQLKRMLNIDSPPSRPKKVKVYIPPTRRSDRFVERPFNYFEEGPEIEEEDTEYDYEENGRAANESPENNINIEFTASEEA
ncbi:hypothetical protein V8E51_005309 [Hyaloscypha variabilis]